MASQSGKRLISGPQPATTLPDDLVLEILILLPGKDISRCKCVCKSWRSMISSPLFREVHRNRHGGLMLYYSKYGDWVPCENGFRYFFRFYISLLWRLKDPAEASIIPMSELSIPTRFSFDHDIRIVNGLICVATSEKVFGLDVQLTIYSVCTGEKMTIPEPIPYVSTISTFHLGYDPASRTYKLLRLIFRTKDGGVIDQQVRANIMTLKPSDTLLRWRKLNYKQACICNLSMRTANDLYDAVRSENSRFGMRRFSGDDGVLCWFHFRGDCMILFDLSKEKFRRLKLPAELAGSTKQVIGSRAVFKECGRLALTLWTVDPFVRPKIYIECFVLEEDDGERWSRQYCRQFPTQALKPTSSFGFAIGSSDHAEALFIVWFKNQTNVYCYSCQVNKTDEFWIGNFRTDPRFRIDGSPYYLGDSNYLYMTLDDVLRGVF